MTGHLDLLSDVRYAWRQFRKDRIFTIAAVLTLTLGIGATTTAFTVARGVLWRPLPFVNPERLVVVWEADAKHGYGNHNEASFADFLEWRDGQAGFDRLTALAYRSLNLTGAGDPERLQAAAPSVDFFDMLGVSPALGRAFTRDEEQPAAAPTAILGHRLWVRRFGADPQVIGRTIALNGVATTVIGVLPADFRFEFPTRRDVDIWVPRVVSAQARQARRSRGLYVVGRLSSGTSAASAQARLSAIMARLAADYPQTNAGWDVRLIALQEQVAGSARTPLMVLLAAGACLLLIVCANLGTLLLARSASRQGEMAARAAIGATPGRLLRQLLVESIVLALVGGVAGLLIAQCAVSAIGHGTLGIDLPRLHELRLDGIAIAFASALSLASSIAFGLVPARQALAADLSASLRGAAARGGTAATARQSMLAAAEVAIAVTLLIAAGLLFKSLSRLQQVDPGFDPHGVLTFQMSLPETSYAAAPQITAFYGALMARLGDLPGVAAAGAVTNLPLGGSNQTNGFSVEGVVDSSPRLREANYRTATPGYFPAMRLRLIRGRLFDEHDVASAPSVAIVNEAFARQLWPGVDPIGRRMKFGRLDDRIPWTTVVGVIGDVRHTALRIDPAPEVYMPDSQNPNGYMYVAVRSDRPPDALIRAIADEVHAIDASLPIFKLARLDELVDTSIAEPRLNARLIGAFGIVALLLAVGGTYGVVSYATSRRTREIGVRLALGAGRRDVMQALMVRGASATALGAAAGTLAALALMRLLETMLFGVTSHDPATFIAAPLILLAVALAACAVPAWRATKLDPATVLRD